MKPTFSVQAACILVAMLIAVSFGTSTRSHADDGPDGRLEFKELPSRQVEIKRGDSLFDVKIDAAGNFVPVTLGKPNVARVQLGPDPRVPINGAFGKKGVAWDGTETVYEFRSGTLILGALDSEGDFVPKVGEKVIAFNDYLKSTTAKAYLREDRVRIYNLPGKLIPVIMGK